MNGIDISRWNNIDLSGVPCDFVIVKATQGTSYVSPLFKQQIEQADRLGKLLGIYHYAGGGGAIPEATHFLNTVKDYIGKAILVLDWEGEQNPNFSNPEYAKAFLAYVKQYTGIIPFIYMSKSVCRQYSWNPEYPLWCAQYKNQQPTGYQEDPWTDKKGFGAWKNCIILQYSSKGRLPGYDGNLDLDKAYIDKNEWNRYARGDVFTDEPTTPTLRKGDIGEAVKCWQTFLNQKGYDCGKPDGIFGDRTEKAVIKWQQDHGMESGYIGPQTWETVGGVS